MRVFVAGASGAIGRRLVPQLIGAGHQVIGTHNSPSSAELLRKLGARPVRRERPGAVPGSRRLPLPHVPGPVRGCPPRID